jgi:hypothetical protein
VRKDQITAPWLGKMTEAATVKAKRKNFHTAKCRAERLAGARKASSKEEA